MKLGLRQGCFMIINSFNKIFTILVQGLADYVQEGKA